MKEKNYKSFNEFEYSIDANKGGIFDAIQRAYIKHYIDEGLLRSVYEGAILSVLQSTIYTFYDFVKLVHDEVNVEYTNHGLDTIHRIKYTIHYKDIKITPVKTDNVLDPVKLKVSGLTHKDLEITLSPEIDELYPEKKGDEYWDDVNVKISNAISIMFGLIDAEDSENTDFAFDNIEKVFGVDRIDTDGYVNLSTGYNDIEEIIHNEVEAYEYDHPAEEVPYVYDENVGEFKVEYTPLSGLGGVVSKQYTDKSGLLGCLTKISAVMTIYAAKNENYNYTMYDALATYYRAVSVLYNFHEDFGVVYDENNSRYYTTLNMDSKINISANIIVDKDVPVTIEAYDVVDEVFRKHVYTMWLESDCSEDDMFLNGVVFLQSLLEDYDYNKVMEPDEVMLGRLGVPNIFKFKDNVSFINQIQDTFELLKAMHKEIY